MDTLMETHSVSPALPGLLCGVPTRVKTAAQGSTLLYEDESKHPHIVRWLDCTLGVEACNTIAPKGITHLAERGSVFDMDCLQTAEEQLLFTALEKKGMRAYNTCTDALEWPVNGQLIGFNRNMSIREVSADGKGHLFVCDTANACVHVFSTDGAYVDSLAREGECNLGEPWRIRWSKSLSQLILIHRNGEKCRVSLISVDTP